eukprot:Hpha_TRINITY_DN15843_c7_g3::TRINITY_DN15843_c7_g3_i1::g.187622::m.187622/K00022/HADH; 3-hydroxyacyl-CoA dehydrogenase
MMRRCVLQLSSHAAPKWVQNVTVLGGGTMGAGIAQVTAASGHYNVKVLDLNPDVLVKSKAGIEKSVTRIAGKKFQDPAEAKNYVDHVLSKVNFVTDIGAASDADLVIEAIVENMDVKKKVWAEWDKVAKPTTIFASNTSSLSISEMASATSRAEQFGGLHFFSPVAMMKLVEVINGDNTNAHTSQTLTEFTHSIGKVPVACKDTPGFIVNRLLVPYMMEAVRLLERGVASAKDIDTAMKLGAGHPMGPFTLADNVGNDVLKFIIDGWHKENPDVELFKPSKTLTELVESGKLGVKSGEGWFNYKK